MASEDIFQPGADITVQIDEMCDNVLTVINKKMAVKGLLLPLSNKNNQIFDKLLTECKELHKNYENEQEKKPQSSLCVADSTLSHNQLESFISHNNNNNIDEICAQCKTNFKKVPKKVKRSSFLSAEVRKLTNHGFNEDILRKKNDFSRRGTLKKINLNCKSMKKSGFKREKLIKSDDNGNISRPKGLEKFMLKRDGDNVAATRRTSERALKTRANEKIIDLCTKRKSVKRLLLLETPRIKKEGELAVKVTDETKKTKTKKVKVEPPRISDVSIYDFVDEDCASEPPTVKIRRNSAVAIKKLKSVRRQKSVTGNIECESESPAVKIRRNSTAVIKKLKSVPRQKSATGNTDCESESPTINIRRNSVAAFKKMKSVRRQRSATGNTDPPIDFDCHSQPAVTSYEHEGAQFSINDIIWAKIPGYPFWPAHINSFDNISQSKTCGGKRCRINWIGWNQKSYLPLKSLYHFREQFANKFSSKLKSPKYKAAILLACKELGLDFEQLEAECASSRRGCRSPERTSVGGSHGGVPSPRRRKSAVNLDEIFTCRTPKSMSEVAVSQKSCSEDEDTDEEEKARSALITAESLEATTKLSGLISRVD